MRFKKIAAVCAAAAAMAAMAVSVSAADWSQTSYADNDPNTVKIVETTKDGVKFTNGIVNTDIAKARITLDKILKNPDDYSKIRKMTWTVTYDGVTPDFESEIGISGGTWATNVNAQGYTIRPEYDENDKAIWDKTQYVIEDFAEWGVDDKPKCPEKDGEMVFMDWSNADIASQGVTVTISNFKIFDADGNEIEQLGFGEYSENGAAAEEKPEEKPEETPADDGKEEEPESKPGYDVVEEPSAETGNEGIFVAMAAVAASAITLGATRKKKD